MSVTIKDVAKRAGVSISTVSRVINNSKPVSNEIRQRVMSVIKETGYVPNPVARSLVTKKSQLIGVIVPDISNFFIGELLNGIEEVGKIYEYDILLCNSYGEIEEELKYINLLKSKQVAGIIFVTWKMSQEHVDAIKEGNLPSVYISKNAHNFDVYSVSIDNKTAAYEMTKYLIEKGHRQIGFIRSSIEDDIIDSERFKGYKDALEDNNIQIDNEIIKEGDTTSESGYYLMNEILNIKKPDAIFATSDEVAIGAINCILDKGYKVPDDISVVGFDDIKLASLYRPSLTTVKQPIYDMGAVSIRMIVKMIDGEEIEDKHTYLPYELVERQSVKKR
ncbi:transcriptional regulator, LacI family [Alkalithermobacter thermoalcaliphilus JW-YL-7 = DSM 7308]|uniref:Transcriptional regulator, LacI family n=1 Tax=Alkalithermobacter thermoalcaliphilus JW-YL-7 = DSM 7308 TaxID=1121328 RepID=A0A150FRG7_CLOPD|nr:transcriptional regulator, LacI family [[Clostridium] paradoxum JW-YL-7 = DSM 7308]SHK42434.1 transcriptional regulator, LacI family [[Clostridium] paradoxum JW-YL-7 = DSM 7308]